MTTDEKAELKKLYDRYVELKPLADEFRIVVDKLRPMLCPLKTGEIVTWVCGGRKLRGRVRTVSVNYWERDDPSRWFATATIIRADGTEGTIREIGSSAKKEVAS